MAVIARPLDGRLKKKGALMYISGEEGADERKYTGRDGEPRVVRK
jgi:hypothetical protein